MAARTTIHQDNSKKGGKQYKSVNLSPDSYAQLVALAAQYKRTIKTQLEVLIDAGTVRQAQPQTGGAENQ